MPKPLADKNYTHPWINLTSKKLLDWRICDLGLQISGSPLEACIQQLYRELEKNGVRFRPHFYVGCLMQEINTLKPHICTHRQETRVSKINITLYQYYKNKKERYLEDPLKIYDQNLLKLFSKKPVGMAREHAAQFLRRTRRELGYLLSEWTIEFHFRIDQLFNAIINRYDELDLYVTKDNDRQKEELTACLSVQIMNHANKKGFYVSI